MSNTLTVLLAASCTKKFPVGFLILALTTTVAWKYCNLEMCPSDKQTKRIQSPHPLPDGLYQSITNYVYLWGFVASCWTGEPSTVNIELDSLLREGEWLYDSIRNMEFHCIHQKQCYPCSPGNDISSRRTQSIHDVWPFTNFNKQNNCLHVRTPCKRMQCS